MQYNNGMQTTLMKEKEETEDDMQVVTLKKKQFIAKQFWKRIDRATKEIQFIDQNDNIILRLPCYDPQQKDEFGRYKDDSA